MKKLFLMVLAVLAVWLVSFPGQPMAATDAKKIDLKTVLPSSAISDIYYKYEKIHDEIKRGEFEKKADFEKRIAALSKKHEEMFFMEVPVRLEYDIDAEKFLFNVRGIVFSDSPLQITLHEIEKRLGDYEASNAFGVKKEISKFSRNTFEIVVVNIDRKSKFTKEYDFLLFVNYPPEKAKELKPHLKLVGEFIPSMKGKGEGFTHEDSSYHDKEPTLSFPYEIRGAKRTIYAKVKNFHAIHDETGEIIKSFPFK